MYHNIIATAPALPSTAWASQPILNHAVPVLQAAPRLISSVASRVLGAMQGELLVQSLKAAGKVTLNIGLSVLSTTLKVILVVLVVDVVSYIFSNLIIHILSKSPLNQEGRLRQSLDWVVISFSLPFSMAGRLLVLLIAIVPLIPLWSPGYNTSFSSRLKDLGCVIAGAIACPFALIFYEGAALVGIVNPGLGRELFGKVCARSGSPWIDLYLSFDKIEELRQQDAAPSITKEDIFWAIVRFPESSDQEKDELLHPMTHVLTSKERVVEKESHDVSFAWEVERYKAQEVLRIIEQGNPPLPAPFSSIDEEQAFLQELKNAHIGQCLCPISGKFIRHPVHHKTHRNLVVEGESLVAAKRSGKTQVVINGEIFPVNSFEESFNLAEEATRGTLYSKFRAVHALEQEIVAGYQALAHPETLQKIPKMAWHYPFLREFRCEITGEPIRIVVSVEHEGSGRHIYYPLHYEERALREWIKTKPHERPPKWPKDTPFDEAHIQINEDDQRRIEGDLRTIAEQIRKYVFHEAAP